MNDTVLDGDTGVQAGPQPGPRAFLKLVGAVVAALGGVTALFAFLSFLPVQSYIVSIGIYGLAEFPVQFYKEAASGFLVNFLWFYAEMPYLLPVAMFIALLPPLYIISPQHLREVRKCCGESNYSGPS